MKRSRFTEEQIIAILREQETGVPVADLCRKHGLIPIGAVRDSVGIPLGGEAGFDGGTGGFHHASYRASPRL